MESGAARGDSPNANGPAQQRLIDSVKSEVAAGAAPARASIFKPAPARPAPSSNPIEHRMAEEIECIRRHLDLLGSTLANDLVLVRRYTTQLQSIDLVNQLLGHLANVIAADNKALAIDQVGHQELRARLKRRPLPGV